MNKIYPELSPKERIPKIVREFLFPHFEKQGFKTLKSGLTIKRECGDLVHEVEIFKNHRNYIGAVCAFEVWASIYSPTYNKWHKLVFGEKLLNTKLIASRIELLPGSTIDPIEGDFDFERHDNNQLIDEIVSNINDSVIPFFNDHLRIDDVIETIESEKTYHKIATLLDLCELRKDEVKAKNLIKWFRFGTFFRNYNHIKKEYKQRLIRVENGYNKQQQPASGN